MKFVRPLMEIEAMPMRDAQGKIVSYCCDFGESRATMILTAAELETQGFRLLNGHVPGKPLKRRKTNYRSSGEAPDLSGEEVMEKQLVDKANEMYGVYDGVSLVESGVRTRRIVNGEELPVEPAQEYDHQ